MVFNHLSSSIVCYFIKGLGWIVEELTLEFTRNKFICFIVGFFRFNEENFPTMFLDEMGSQCINDLTLALLLTGTDVNRFPCTYASSRLRNVFPGPRYAELSWLFRFLMEVICIYQSCVFGRCRIEFNGAIDGFRTSTNQPLVSILHRKRSHNDVRNELSHFLSSFPSRFILIKN
ncbi:hypothetical protein D3C87_1400680 [compost metagenome]